MDNYTTLSVSIDDTVGNLVLTRPDKFNSMNTAFWLEFPQAIRALSHKGDVRVIVISAQGQHFCSGMDLQVFSQMGTLLDDEPARRAEKLRQLVLELQDVFNAIEQCRVPVLVAAQGGVIGGALDLLCACDCRYATSDAFFTIKETVIGMTADLGTLQRLPKIIGPGMAKELAYTGRNLSAQDALQCGLVNGIFDNHQSMLAHVQTVAKQIAANSPVAVSGCKKMINYSMDHSIHDSLEYMATWQAGFFHTQEIQQTLAAQAKKAAPDYAPLPAQESLMSQLHKQNN